MEYICQDDTFEWCGVHLLVDIWKPIDGFSTSIEELESIFYLASRSSGATILNCHFNGFPNGGITGILVLQESHISIHTWPERNYIAVDIFMCGDCNPNKALKFIVGCLQPETFTVSEHKRGIQLK